MLERDLERRMNRPPIWSTHSFIPSVFGGMVMLNIDRVLPRMDDVVDDLVHTDAPGKHK